MSPPRSDSAVAGYEGGLRPGSGGLLHFCAARPRRLRAREACLAATLAIALLGLSAAGASALIVRLPGRTLSYLPSARANKNASSPKKNGPVEYHGGPVMTSNTNYALYWDPSGPPEYPAGYQAGLNKYFEDLAHDSGGAQNTDSVLVQYKNGAGESASYNSHFGGPLIDTDPYPPNGCSAAAICLTDAQLRSEIAAYLTAHALPIDLAHEYFLLTPPGVESCFEAASQGCSAGTAHAAFCAYHGAIRWGKSFIVYSNDPYVAGQNCDVREEHPNGNASDATIAGGLAHEHSESVTDPLINAWYDSLGEEVGDKCRTFKPKTEFGPPLGKAPNRSNYNQVINGDLYYYQQEWSNELGGCAQRATALPTVSKVTPKAGPASGGTQVTITGTNFRAPASVKFGASPAGEVKVNSSGVITAISPAGSAGIVDVTVTTPDGTSAITKKDRFKYKVHR
jgi:IPT/TIG domain